MADYEGTWALVPELCIYEQGEPPPDGRYVLRRDGDRVEATIGWTGPDGTAQQTAFGGPVDGSRQPVDGPGVTHLTITHVDGATLDSAAYAGDELLMYARRRASGDLLTTVQTMHVGGAHHSNFQVYRRVDGD